MVAHLYGVCAHWILTNMARHESSNGHPNRAGGLEQLWLVGFAGGLLGAVAMDLFSRAVIAVRNGREATGAAPGHDRLGRGVQPPQAEGPAEHDATVRVGTAAYHALTASTPGRAAQSWLGTAVHYAFGGTVGAWYAVTGEHLPMIRAAHGTAFGSAVWIVADEMIMPLLGLSRGPRQMPLGIHAFALAVLWVYVLTLESVVQATVSRRPRTNHGPRRDAGP